MKKNAWFFWIDRLHITPSERYLVTGLLALYAILWLVTPFFDRQNSFDEAYYAPLMAEFTALTADRYEARKTLLDQYYPGQQDTIEVLARQLIPLPFQNEVDEELERRRAPFSSSEADTLLRVSLNSANVSELTRLPGIGPAIASRIVEYRAENGPFQSKEDVMKVRGIGPARFEQIKDYLTL